MINKKLLFIALAIGIIGCTQSNVETKNTEYIVGDKVKPLQEIQIEGCQYLFGDWGYGTILTHKI